MLIFHGFQKEVIPGDKSVVSCPALLTAFSKCEITGRGLGSIYLRLFFLKSISEVVFQLLLCCSFSKMCSQGYCKGPANSPCAKCYFVSFSLGPTLSLSLLNPSSCRGSVAQNVPSPQSRSEDHLSKTVLQSSTISHRALRWIFRLLDI